MADCRWVKSNGNIIGAQTKDGKKSQLFEDLKNKFGNDTAIEMYAVSQSDDFQEIFEGETSMDNVIRYVANQNQATESLSKEQTADLTDFDNFDKQTLLDTFYNKDGLFLINIGKLVGSGMYSRFEANTIADDPSLQNQIKNTLERLKNTEDIFVEPQEKRRRTGEFNSFGKLVAIGEDNQVLIDAVDMTDEEFQDVYQRPRPQGYKKAEVFIDDNGTIRAKKITETEKILPITAKITSNQKLASLSSISLETLQQNPQETAEVLDQIEIELAKDGIDVIGLSGKPIDEELKSFLSITNGFIQNPNIENTRIFAEASDEYFQRDLSPKTEVIKGDKNKEYVKLDTTLSEEEVYNQQGLIKLYDNTYIKTAKEDLETLYNNVRTYTEKYPGNSLEKYVQEQIKDYDFQNAEVAEAVVLYKMYFNDGVNEGLKQNNEGVKNTKKLTGNYKYLTEEFPSDFYSKYLTEKRKNSKLFKDFYSNFEVNEKGINLLNDTAKVRIYADDNLKQYSLISRQMSDLTEENNEVISLRDEAINYPQTVEKFDGELFRLNDNEIILKNSAQQFVRVGKDVFESVAKQGNLNHFLKLQENTSNYFISGAEKPSSTVKLNEFSYLENNLENFIKAKKSEKPSELDC